MIAAQLTTDPIGVFDSGVGGLSVWKELYNQLPHESIIYYADSGNCPYGSRPEHEVVSFCTAITKFLIAKRAKLIVVACNTATAMAIKQLREEFSIPIVGIEPAIKPAALQSKTGVIGILATAGTLKGRLFNETKLRFAGNVEVVTTIGLGLVELVEQNQCHTLAAKKLLLQYIQPMLEKGIDNLVLGCTHYPFLTDLITEITQNKVQIIDPAPAVAHQAAQLLDLHKLKNNDTENGSYQFYSTGDTLAMKSLLCGFGVDAQPQRIHLN